MPVKLSSEQTVVVKAIYATHLSSFFTELTSSVATASMSLSIVVPAEQSTFTFTFSSTSPSCQNNYVSFTSDV